MLVLLEGKEKDSPFLKQSFPVMNVLSDALQDTTHSSWSNICEELEISGVSWSRISGLKKTSWPKMTWNSCWKWAQKGEHMLGIHTEDSNQFAWAYLEHDFILLFAI